MDPTLEAVASPSEAEKLAFDRERWAAEGAMRQREIELKEREQHRLDTESNVRIEEARRSRWLSPLVLAVLGAGLAGIFNVAVSLLNGYEQRQVQEQNNKALQQLEESKADSARLLQMIGTNDPDKAAENLQFLVDAGLINSENTKSRLVSFLKSRAPGQGPTLPSVGPSTRLWGVIPPGRVKRMQSALGIAADGSLGPLTQAAFIECLRKVGKKDVTAPESLTATDLLSLEDETDNARPCGN